MKTRSSTNITPKRSASTRLGLSPISANATHLHSQSMQIPLPTDSQTHLELSNLADRDRHFQPFVAQHHTAPFVPSRSGSTTAHTQHVESNCPTPAMAPSMAPTPRSHMLEHAVYRIDEAKQMGSESVDSRDVGDMESNAMAVPNGLHPPSPEWEERSTPNTSTQNKLNDIMHEVLGGTSGQSANGMTGNNSDRSLNGDGRETSKTPEYVQLKSQFIPFEN